MVVPKIEFIAIALAAVLFVLSACIYCWYKIEERRDMELIRSLNSRIRRGRAITDADRKDRGKYAKVATNDDDSAYIDDEEEVTVHRKKYYEDDAKIDEKEFEDGDIELA
jgi:hypothetical protein